MLAVNRAISQRLAVPRSQHNSLGRLHARPGAGDPGLRSRVGRWGLVCALALAAGMLMFWPRGEPDLHAPMPATAAELAAATDAQVVYLATTELRWSLAGDAARLKRWRELDEVARSVLALSWVESGHADPRLAVFRGFAPLLSSQAPNRPTPDDLAQAYDAIGAPEVAEVCRKAQRVADRDAGVDAYVGIDREFIHQRDAVGTLGKLRCYVRGHVAEIAAVRQR